MADDKNTQDKKNADKNPEKAADAANEQVQEAVDKQNELGYRGVEADTTPNENYTVAGVSSGADVPEAAADPVQARKDALNSDLTQ